MHRMAWESPAQPTGLHKQIQVSKEVLGVDIAVTIDVCNALGHAIKKQNPHRTTVRAPVVILMTTDVPACFRFLSETRAALVSERRARSLPTAERVLFRCRPSD